MGIGSALSQKKNKNPSWISPAKGDIKNEPLRLISQSHGLTEVQERFRYAGIFGCGLVDVFQPLETPGSHLLCTILYESYKRMRKVRGIWGRGSSLFIWKWWVTAK